MGFRDPSIQIISMLGPKVFKCCLHWVIWIPRRRGSESRLPLDIQAKERKLNTRKTQP